MPRFHNAARVSALLAIALAVGCESQGKRGTSRGTQKQPKGLGTTQPMVTPKPTTSAAVPPSLYDRLGGSAGITKVVDDFVALGAKNPKVNFTRKGHPNEWEPTDENVALLKKRLVEFVGSATGGPVEYTGRDMVSVHKGMGITNEEFDALAADLKQAMDQNKVGTKEQQQLLEAVEGTRGAIVQPADATKPAVGEPPAQPAEPGAE